MGDWTVVSSEAVLAAALKQCRGCYQRNLVRGNENLSGSTLKGKAARYGSRYAASRRNLLARLEAAGIPVGERVGVRGRRILALGDITSQERKTVVDELACVPAAEMMRITRAQRDAGEMASLQALYGACEVRS